jgi:CheY-specific phosphatase CheX
MGTNYINPFLKAIDNVFETMIHVPFTLGKPVLKKMTSISVPTVVIGQHKVAFPKGVPIISIPCGTEAGNFSIEVALKIL